MFINGIHGSGVGAGFVANVVISGGAKQILLLQFIMVVKDLQ